MLVKIYLVAIIFFTYIHGHVIFYEYLHNEYRRTFIEIHSPLCDIMHSDSFIGGMFRNKGIICPMPVCAVLVPERANVTSWSPKYLDYARLYVTRKSRKSPYYINLESRTKHTWENNVTVNVIFYEYVHNEYRRTFIEIHTRACDLIYKDPFLGRMLKNKDVVCPAPPKDYHLLNMTVPMEDFKYTIPFEKFRVDIDVTHAETKEIMGKGYLYASFKRK